MPTTQPTVSDLDEEQRSNLEQAMAVVVEQMSSDEQHWLIKNLLVTAIYHRRNPDPGVLDDFMRNVRATIRMHADPHYKKSVAGAPPPDPSRPSWDVEEALASLPD